MSRLDARMGPSLADLHPGVHRLDRTTSLSRLASELARAAWATAVVDLSSAGDKGSIMDALSGALDLPSWFGRNWDALDDALRDLSWWPAGQMGRVILVEDARGSSGDTHTDRDVLLDVFETAVDRWASTSSPLVVLLRGSPPGDTMTVEQEQRTG